MLGVAIALIAVAGQILGSEPILTGPEFLLGLRSTIGRVLMHVVYGIRTALSIFFLLFLLRVVLRRQWLAAFVLVAFFSVLDAAGETRQSAILDILSTGLFFSMCAVAVLRWGLTTLAVGVITTDLLLNVPVSRDLSAWYAAPMILLPLSLAMVAAWAFYRAIGGQLLKADPFA